MPIADELKRMNLSEKLNLMEALWDELREAESELPVPDWHRQVLEERERQVSEGTAKFIPWEAAKERIAKRVS
jgi:putative addiction module component (TIGR02574 family)